MLSRTSLTASRASSCRWVALTLSRANSTNAASATETGTPAKPKRSIPLASAFSDLLQPSRYTVTQPTRAKGAAVGLSSLGDDQFDGLGRVRKRSTNQDNTVSKFSASTPRTNARSNNVTTGHPRPSRPSSENYTSRNNNNRDNRQRSQDAGKRQAASNRSSQRIQVGAEGRKESRVEKESRSRQAKSDIPRKDEKVGNKPESLAEALGAQVATNPSSNTAASRKPQQPRAYQQVALTDFSKLVDTVIATPKESNRPSPELYLVGTPTLLEEQAGDYSRYLEQDIARKLAQSTKLSPVDTARVTLARRPDVSLEERAKAVGIMSAVAGFDNAVATTVRA